MTTSLLPCCVLCRRPTKGARPRCHVCRKANWPAPGSPSWHRWTKGIFRTIRARCDAARIPCRPQLLAWEAIILGSVDMPPEVAALIPDILAMPVSPATYWAMLDRAVIVAQVYGVLCREGVGKVEAERLAEEAADWAIARRQAKRLRIAAPPAPALRIATVLDDIEAEHEQRALDEASPAARAPAKRLA